MQIKSNIINELYCNPLKQRGAVLLVMLVILVVGVSALLLSSLNSSALQTRRDKVTADALAQAKEALIGFAASVKLPGTGRPGDLPCPDTDNDGVPGDSLTTTCNLQSQRIGRLPWKTLGLPDLRDASGERLWYVVSNNFKNNTRTTQLNSDTPGTITARNSDGSILNDGSGSSAAVAIIIAPGDVLQREDKTTPQDRSTAGINTPENYLEVANGEDNANFVDGLASDGFIQGRIKNANGNVILNDQLLVVTLDNIMLPIQKRVAKEVINALNIYYCGDLNVDSTGNCIAAGGNRFYPKPADFSVPSCLGTGDSTATCPSAASNRGRIPATPATAWSNSSVLRGTNTSNWFKDNAWREVMYYTVATACTNGTYNCNGTGFLTLNNPGGSPLSNQKVVVIATGSALPGQTRSTMGAQKNTLSNYLEDENLVPLDDAYTKSASPPFNDSASSIP